MGRIPLDRWEAAHKLISDLCHQRRRWQMSIPARPDYDPDLLLGQLLRDAQAVILELQSEVLRLRKDLHCEERAHLKTIDQRDEHEERINSIAIELDLDEQGMTWSSTSDVSENCIEAIAALHATITALQAELAALRKATEPQPWPPPEEMERLQFYATAISPDSWFAMSKPAIGWDRSALVCAYRPSHYLPMPPAPREEGRG